MEIREALTFDDVLLVPAASSVLPSDADTATQVTRSIRMNIPLLSSAMDTVTEARMAIAMAQAGGIGVIHRNLDTEAQAREVRRVKRFESGVVYAPITLTPDQTLADAKALMERYNITGFPVVDASGRVLGIVTNRDMRFASDDKTPVSVMMTADNLAVLREPVDREQAISLMKARRIEKLLVTDGAGKLTGLLTLKDTEKAVLNPQACKDELGRLRVAAASTVGDAGFERSQALIEAGRRHGGDRHRAWPLRGRRARGRADQGAVERGAGGGRQRRHRRGDARADRGRGGCGQGGHRPGLDLHHADRGGRGRAAADRDHGCGGCCGRRAGHRRRRHQVFGRFRQGDRGGRVLRHGRQRHRRHRRISGRGDPVAGPQLQGLSRHGVLGAMARGSADRYFQKDAASDKLVPEGIEGQVPYKGSAQAVIHQMVGGLRAAMGYTGNRTVDEMRTRCQFVRITGAGLKESHVHDVQITRESPNYRVM
jgi:IMP dehydrogenase